jgi:hypothetical protein
MAVYSQNMLWEGKVTIINGILDGNIMYEINDILMQQDADKLHMNWECKKYMYVKHHCKSEKELFCIV